jgi:hypothetical protein
MKLRKNPLLWAALAALLAAPAFSASAEVEAGRKAVKDWGGAVVGVQMTLKTRIVAEGREMNQGENTSTATATFVSPDGLAVMSYSAVNPTEAFERMQLGGEDGGKFSFSTEVSDLKIRMPDGRELPGEVVLRDKDLDMAFVRLAAAPEKALTWVNLENAAQAQPLDTLIFLGRLGKVANWNSSVSLGNVAAVVTKPRTFYVPGSSEGQMGTPAFTLEGKALGILLQRTLLTGDSMRGMGMSLFMDPSHMGFLQVVVPAADVLETAKQVPPRSKDAGTPAKDVSAKK